MWGNRKNQKLEELDIIEQMAGDYRENQERQELDRKKRTDGKKY